MTAPYAPVDLTPELEDALRDTGATKALAALKREHGPKLPKPTLGDIERLYGNLRGPFSAIHAQIQAMRDIRYMRDQLPEKIAKDQSIGKRIHTRLSHNEGLSLAALATRNWPKGTIAPLGEGPQAVARAEKQTRWINRLIPTFQRQAGGDRLWRKFADKVMNDGMAAMEMHYCGGDAYDDPDQFKAREVYDAEMGEYREEKPAETKRRTEEKLMTAQMPIGLRIIDPLSLYFVPWGDHGIPKLLIVEKKNYNDVCDALRDKLGDTKYQELKLPKAGDHGWPVRAGGGGQNTGIVGQWGGFDSYTGPDSQGDVETIRYYDDDWYCYIVDGKIVEGPVAHRMPSLPVHVCLGQVTGSPNLSEMAQGITWGLADLEVALNDVISVDVDNAFLNRRGKRMVIEQDKTDGIPVTSANASIEMKDADTAKRLNPGEKLNVVELFSAEPNDGIVDRLLQIYGRGTQNPIARGQVPGANTPGYVMNSATAATNSLYESALDNLADSAAWMADMARQCVKVTVKEKVYQSVPTKGGGKGTEILGLGPDDITDVPSEFSIDPLDDVNRAAIQQGLRQGNKEGFVPREVVQIEGFGAEDPQLWDDMITEDAAKQSLAAMTVQVALQRIAAIEQARQQPQLVGPDGVTPISSGQQTNGVGAGGAPAQPRPPTVGAGNAAASQEAYGEPGMNTQAAMSGQAQQRFQGNGG